MDMPTNTESPMLARTLLFTCIAAVFSCCVAVPPPANRSAADPADPASHEAASPRYRPNLIASTRVFLDPSEGEGAQKMDHSKMEGMEGMEGMDHSKMQGIDHSKMKGMDDSQMKGMDHSKMPGMKGEPASGEPGGKSPAAKEQTIEEMKNTSDEMKKASDELKAKSDALKKGGGKKPQATPSPEQHQH